MSEIVQFADALRFVGFTASWVGGSIPANDTEFKERFTLYEYKGYVHGDPIPDAPPAPIKKSAYPSLATVLAAMKSRAKLPGG